MILTVTPNTGLDRVLFLPSLQRNRRNQATDVVESMGGKGCDVSLILRELGEETVATGLAGGETGRRMDAMLRRAGVVSDFIWTGGETRLNTVLIETETGDHTTICAPGLQPDEHALPGLLAWIDRWAPSAQAVVLAGSLPEGWPPETYRLLVEHARQAGSPVVVDVAGPALLSALDAGVAAIKPNREELEAVAGCSGTRGARGAGFQPALEPAQPASRAEGVTSLLGQAPGPVRGTLQPPAHLAQAGDVAQAFQPAQPSGTPPGDPDEEQGIIQAARRLCAQGAGWVLASRGGEGAVLVSERGAWRAPALDVPVINPAGAGDGMTACLALGLTRGWDEEETLRWAIAVAAAIVTTRGTAEICSVEVERLLPQAQVEQLSRA